MALLAVGCFVPAPPRSRQDAAPTGSREAAGATAARAELAAGAPAASAIPDRAPAFARMARAEVPGVELVRYEPWGDASAAHPRGTVVALGFEGQTPWLVEVDVATATPVGRQSPRVPPGSRIEITRSGDRLHAGIQEDHTFEWITYDSSLVERRRVALPGMGKEDLHESYSGFGVEGGHAVVVTQDGRAYVFDEHGIRGAKHDCRPLSAVANARPTVAYANGLAVIQHLTAEDVRPALCAFRPDGRGATLKSALETTDSVFELDGALYLRSSNSLVRQLDGNLRPTDPPIADPRAPLPPERCAVTGDVVVKDEWRGGVDIVLTAWCCGGEPGGLFFCYPGESDPVPRSGTRGAYRRDLPN